MYKSILMQKFAIAIATAVLMTAGNTRSAVAASLYSITDLGDLGGAYPAIVKVNDINNKGQVVGTSTIKIYLDFRGFLWENGLMTELQQPIYLQGRYVGIGEAQAINDQGNIAGWTTGASKIILSYVIWKDKSSSVTGPIGYYSSSHASFNPYNPPSSDISISSFNNLGQLVLYNNQFGYSLFWDWEKSQEDPYSYSSMIKQLVIFPELSSYSVRVSTINDVGQVIGSSPKGGFLCEGGVTSVNMPPSYPTGYPIGYGGYGYICQQGITYLGFNPYKINNTGQIIGEEFLWEKGSVTKLGFVGKDINNLGQILGSMSLWENGNLFDINDLLLNNPGWEILEAKAINDLGQIVGQGRFNGQERAFIMNPISGTQAQPKSVPSSVPEPAFTWGLLGLGALAALMSKRKQQW